MAGNDKVNTFSDSLKKSLSEIDAYFKSLNQVEIIAWSLIGLGIILIILGIIFM